MKLTKQLQNIAKELGLPTDLKEDKSRKCWIKTNDLNGIWFELEVTKRGVWRLIVEYNNEENAQIIFDGNQHLDPYMKGKGCWFACEDADELLAVATEVKNFILTEGLTRQGRNRKRQTTDEGYFEGVATIIKAAVDAGFWHVLDRGALGFDAHDGLITLGKSAAVLADPAAAQWREHLVPCTMIIERAVELFEEGATIPTVAQMVKENLAIVVITAAEAKKVDALYQTTMPEGWNWGDSVFARLDALNIKY